MGTIKLNNGVEMPILGYGVYLVSSEEYECCAANAIAIGYCSVDTVQTYFCEEQGGNAVRKSGYPVRRTVRHDQSMDHQCRQGADRLHRSAADSPVPRDI